MMFEDVKIGGKDKDYLAGVLRVWDCYAQDWIPDSPVLLRFESDDVLILAGGRVLAGPVLTEKPFEASMPEEAYADIALKAACPYWARDPQARKLIGGYMSVNEVIMLGILP